MDTPTTPALGPTQPPVQWVPGLFSRGYSDRGVKLTIYIHLVLRLGISESNFLCRSLYCLCVLYYCHRMATQLQLNIYHIYHIISYYIIYHIISYII
jgi:hypothetical protein